MNQMESRFYENVYVNDNSDYENELVYKNHLIKLQQEMFNRRLIAKSNRCSSYRDTTQNLNIIVQKLNDHHDYANLSPIIDAEIMRETMMRQQQQFTTPIKSATKKTLTTQLRTLINQKLKKLQQKIQHHNSNKDEPKTPKQLVSDIKSTVKKSGKRKSLLVIQQSSRKQQFDDNESQLSSLGSEKKCKAKLINFSYKKNTFVVDLDDNCSGKKRAKPFVSTNSSSSVSSNEKSKVCKKLRMSSQLLNSEGESTSSSSNHSSSYSSTKSSSSVFKKPFEIQPQPQQQKQQQQQSTLNFDLNEISTSTPLMTRKQQPAVKCLSYEYDESDLNDESIESFGKLNNDLSQLVDQSTQAYVESPVLVESTFNTSSVSNLSDDLIILQTQAQPPRNGFVCASTMKKSATKKRSFNNSSFRKAMTTTKKSVGGESESANDWNLLVINKFCNNTNCSLENIPEWAMGNNLNVALVNQAYFNPNANGVFIR